ncbi:MmgE/PrpD family protein [Bosea sp. 124]|uniref:MmgE/PrpD family protein n=1 Tax=Bosea sp. 124 TaxID=2135642 RepID=UPI000D4A12A8|nr:MmgE/PrpD family protein [Bosea sp. 124]PTM39765.1 2-methylcitrate dehydratase PrpD [Bosea sp. 124]
MAAVHADMPEPSHGPAASLTRMLARAALAAEPAGFGEEVQAKLKICLIDFLSCCFEAYDLPTSRQARAIARSRADGAAIIGSDILATPGEAAFANGTTGHGLVREDMHAGSISHHGVVVWPTLLALAQDRSSQDQACSGAALLKAALVGYEGGARLGRALFDADLARLFRPTGTVGPIGGALAGAILLGLSEDEIVAALGLAANTSGGLNQWPHTGAGDMYFHPGFAARSAVTAVELAAAGAYASETILEGEAGLFAAFRRGPPRAPVALFADGKAEILAVYNKPVPACNFAQTACQAALRVADQIEDPGEIETLTVDLPDAAIRYPGCDFAGPFAHALQAKMSIQYGVAAALRRGVVEEANYARLDEPVILHLARLASLRRDAGFTAAFPARQGAEVAVTLRNGTRINHRLSDVVPATESEIRARFRASAGERLGLRRADEIEALIDGLETLTDAGRIGRLCLAGDGAVPARTRRAAAKG